MIQLNVPDLEEVIEAANDKGLKPYQIAEGIKKSTQTVYAYFNGERVSLETMETIINYINSYARD